MNTKELFKLAASAPIALASAGGAYYMASAETEAESVKVARIEERLDAATKLVEQLQEQSKAYQYQIQKATNELAVIKASKQVKPSKK
jgi:hypothetical protein